MVKGVAIVLSTLLTAGVLIGLLNSNTTISDKKQLITQDIQTDIPYIFAAECTQSLVVQCAADVQMTVRNCAAAFETGGANIIADIKCTKDLLADKKHCWPCICAEAKKKGWKIIGC